MRIVRAASVGVAACALVGVVYGMGAASAAGGAGGAPSSPAAASGDLAPALVVARPTPSGTTAAGSTAGDEGQRLRRFCTVRLPRLQDRLGKVVARLTGGTNDKGSIVALRQRIDAATAAGHQAEADLLRIMLDRRTQRLSLVRSTQTDLSGWQQKYCASA